MEINKKYKGVTFAELIVVIAIIGIMSSVGFVSLQSSKANARLQAAQREVAATIKLAQSYALQGKMIGAITPCEYGFKFTSLNSYQIFYKPPVSGDCTSPGSETSAEIFVLNDGVVLDNPVIANTIIRFTIPFSVMTPPITPIFTFRYPAGTGATKTITINTNGNIAEN